MNYLKNADWPGQTSLLGRQSIPGICSLICKLICDIQYSVTCNGKCSHEVQNLISLDELLGAGVLRIGVAKPRGLSNELVLDLTMQEP